MGVNWPKVERFIGGISVSLYAALFLLGGAAGTTYGWKEANNYEAMKTQGTETLALITAGTAKEGRDGKKSYTVNLSWKDKAGRERTSGPRHVSPAFAQQIAPDGKTMVIRGTRIRYLETAPGSAPVILDDQAEYESQLNYALYGGPIFLAVGLIFAWLTWRRAAAAARRG